MPSLKTKIPNNAQDNREGYAYSVKPSVSARRKLSAICFDYPTRTESSLLDSFAAESITGTVTLLNDMPVVSGDLTHSNGMSVSTTTVARCSERKPRRTFTLSQLKKTALGETSKEAAVERLLSVIKSDRAESLPAGSRHLSRFNRFK